jgi:microcystin degradation protein MlrC
MAGRSGSLGPTALLKIGGIRVVVVSVRHQALEPMMFEHLGIDLWKVRSLVLKSRGHFRAGFDEFFTDDRIIEADCPGLVTPMLARVPFRHIRRPMWPFDPDLQWSPS